MGREFEQKEEFRLLPNICKTKFLFMQEENITSIILNSTHRLLDSRCHIDIIHEWIKSVFERNYRISVI